MDMNGSIDDSAIQRGLAGVCVDYLSHDWAEDEVWASWKAMTRHKAEMANGVRLENASWRTWAKQRGNLQTISPETLNWLKDSDVTWLYGPLHTAVEAVPPARESSTSDRLNLDSARKSILKHKNHHFTTSEPTLEPAKKPKPKSIKFSLTVQQCIALESPSRLDSDSDSEILTFKSSPRHPPPSEPHTIARLHPTTLKDSDAPVPDPSPIPHSIPTSSLQLVYPPSPERTERGRPPSRSNSTSSLDRSQERTNSSDIRKISPSPSNSRPLLRSAKSASSDSLANLVHQLRNNNHTDSDDQDSFSVSSVDSDSDQETIQPRGRPSPRVNAVYDDSQPPTLNASTAPAPRLSRSPSSPSIHTSAASISPSVSKTTATSPERDRSRSRDDTSAESIARRSLLRAVRGDSSNSLPVSNPRGRQESSDSSNSELSRTDRPEEDEDVGIASSLLGAITKSIWGMQK